VIDVKTKSIVANSNVNRDYGIVNNSQKDEAEGKGSETLDAGLGQRRKNYDSEKV